jgi:hypothetical protein
MVMELFPECHSESNTGLIDGEAIIMEKSIYDDFGDIFISKDDRSIFNDPPFSEQAMEVSGNKLETSEQPQMGMLELEIDLKEFGINEPPSNDVKSRGESLELHVDFLSGSDFSNDIGMVEGPSEGLSLEIGSVEVDCVSEKQERSTEETSMDGLDLPDCLDPEPTEASETHRSIEIKVRKLIPCLCWFLCACSRYTVCVAGQ